MNTIQQLILSALHNATSAATATVATSPMFAPFLTTGQPTGGALNYVNSHPWAAPLYLITFFVARDLLKKVPAFGSASGTTQAGG